MKTLLIILFLLVPTFASAEVFFPVETSKYNGYEVTIQNWSGLTNAEKTIFIYEVIGEIEEHEGRSVHIKDQLRLQIATDVGLNYLMNKQPNLEIPMLKFFLDLFKAEGYFEADESSTNAFGNVAKGQGQAIGECPCPQHS